MTKENENILKEFRKRRLIYGSFCTTNGIKKTPAQVVVFQLSTLGELMAIASFVVGKMTDKMI